MIIANILFNLWLAFWFFNHETSWVEKFNIKSNLPNFCLVVHYIYICCLISILCSHFESYIFVWEYGLMVEKEMAPHSSTLAWKIPWTEAPGRLQSMGRLRVRHDWATSLSLFTFIHWRKKWQPTPVFLPGESQGRGNLVGAVSGVTQSRKRLKPLSSSSSSSSSMG